MAVIKVVTCSGMINGGGRHLRRKSFDSDISFLSWRNDPKILHNTPPLQEQMATSFLHIMGSLGEK